MSIEPKLMDPARLRLLTRLLELPSPEIPAASVNAEGGGDVFHLVDELLAHAKHLEFEAYELGERLKATRADLAKARATVDEVTHVVNLGQEKAARYRDRCPVTAEDVEADGVTYAHLDAFAAVHGFTPARWNTPGLKRGRGASDIGWARDGVYIGDYAAWPGNRNRGWETDGVAAFVAMASTELDRPAFDILDEMAAMDPG